MLIKSYFEIYEIIVGGILANILEIDAYVLSPSAH